VSLREAVFTPAREVYLFSSLIKKDKYEWVLEKCTELGVTHFVPVLSARTEKKDFNQERGKKIIKEAAEQSGKSKLPNLSEPRPLDKALEEFSGIANVALHLGGETFKTIDPQSYDIGIWIGPEGGWSDAEIELFRQHSVPIATLGPQILRSETAAVAVSSILLM
jgi:16S rRNA (uracil1498-N3)-methyltransferase